VWVPFVRHKVGLHDNLARLGEVHIFGIGSTTWRDDDD
jgi:hypothetical protein